VPRLISRCIVSPRRLLPHLSAGRFNGRAPAFELDLSCGTSARPPTSDGAGSSDVREQRLGLDHVAFEGKPSTRPSPRAPQRPPSPAQASIRPSRSSLDPFVATVLLDAGLDPQAYRPEPLNRRLPACLRALKVTSVASARELLASDPGLSHKALDALLIGVTQFVRDESAFEALVREALPEFGRQRGPLHVWSAGCANGAELHTVALLFADAGLAERTRFLGTDCRDNALREARAACYDEAALSPLHRELRSRYFEASETGWRLSEALCEKIVWRQADLTRETEPGPWDLILFRNAAIYLSDETTTRLWEQLRGVLRPGGFLMTGKAERPVAAGLVRRGPCLSQRVEVQA
jgi:chemotaxis protein methyltransferase CheR